MKFIPNSPLKKTMLQDLNLTSIDELFTDIPKKIRIDKLNLQKGISQQETELTLKEMAKKNISCYDSTSFIGGGIKPHYIPAVVKSITSRSEFYTAYTPYQSEASQGFLKAMFEYQSMIASITNMDVANCSLYDGATALGESALMATRITKKKTFLIPSHISWEKKSVLQNYVKGAGIKIIEIPTNFTTGTMDINELKTIINDDISALYIENPNYFGMFEKDIKIIQELIHNKGILFIIGIDPLSLGIIKSPGELDADIVIGEGRCLGNSMDFGGSSLGIFACSKEFTRNIPGRLIGLTTDNKGNEAFCMTLQTREQHIRRGKATSNICTNEGLCALAAATYLAWLGGDGLQKISEKNFKQGQLLKKELTKIKGFSSVFSGPHFNEFVIRSEIKPEKLNEELLQYNIHGGLLLEQWFPFLKNTLLFGITELHSNVQIRQFIDAIKEVTHV